MKKLLLLSIMTFTLQSCADKEVPSIEKSNSASEPIYKCTGEASGGFNQEKEGPRLVKFHKSDYRIVPFEKIPDEAIKDIEWELFHRGILLETNGDRTINGKRKAYLQYANSLTRTSFIDEGHWWKKEGLMFVRRADKDPKSGYSYIDCKEKYITKGLELVRHHIICGQNKRGLHRETFVFDSGSFIAANFSTRSVDLDKDYYGDSSSFTFGTCKKYYD